MPYRNEVILHVSNSNGNTTIKNVHAGITAKLYMANDTAKAQNPTDI